MIIIGPLKYEGKFKNENENDPKHEDYLKIEVEPKKDYERERKPQGLRMRMPPIMNMTSWG